MVKLHLYCKKELKVCTAYWNLCLVNTVFYTTILMSLHTLGSSTISSSKCVLVGALATKDQDVQDPGVLDPTGLTVAH
jgi:hypothetical protein